MHLEGFLLKHSTTFFFFFLLNEKELDPLQDLK